MKICPLCGKEVSPLASYIVVEDTSGQRYDAHIECAKGISA